MDEASPPDGQLSDKEIIREKMPLLLGLLTGGHHFGSSSGNLKNDSNATDASEKGIRCGVVSQVNGRWETVYWTGTDVSVAQERAAHELASEALENGEITQKGEFSAIGCSAKNLLAGMPPAGSHDSSSARDHDAKVMPGAPHCAMLLSIGGRPAPAAVLQTLTVTLSRFLALNRDRQEDKRRLWQTTCMLHNAAAWQQLDDDAALLQSVAQCACEVLGCDRATIFLWDRARHRLVGRPAIGVEGGVLEVEDDAGIVGEVLREGSPQWWSAGGIDGERVNRRVDQSQNFQTKSLLAVPMFNARDQIIGVFEAINAKSDDHRGGKFDAADVRTLSELAVHAAVAIDTQRTRANLTRTRDRLVSQAADSNRLIGEHDSIRDVRTNATKVAPTDLSVLILGKNGTGKEVLAQHIHYQSERRNGPFVAVNCAALVESLLESELFGHERGAFTDASSTRQGKFELAHGGTLFLDEVGDMSPGGQAKLLRVLEERVVVRVGGSQPIPVDVRVIAATNQPLQELIASKRFREDLFFRLNVVSLTLPPLCKRGRDVLLLAEHFLSHFCEKIGRVVPRLDLSAQQAILSHPWPGNVRELRNTIERLCYLTSGPDVSANDLMLQDTGGTSNEPNPAWMEVLDPNLNEATRLFQIDHIEKVIASQNGNMTEAAATLGVHRSNLYRKMRQLGMPTSETSERVGNPD
ncbi:sigma-54-dependent Fis family transcriptional regulator [Neorhodopirellula pilleata]|uniref:Nitrogen fixation protein VnfA n=1 Tax=Neorhodopirellula pilleata TaxID=2714738 RepID=A0A5C6A9I8_9BACT|nr:sigma-54-dependent Fis family transcriptional regulator [Neorhodopirellula pilleata]TWT94993.1 Nitrogen fixation protein VnfA [Neorhodopirellula pilleata]